MADISKIKLPDNSEYDFSVYTDHIKPMMSKTYTGVIGTAANWADSTFFFAKVKPSDYYAVWRVHYKVYCVAEGRNDARAISDVTISATQSAYKSYAVMNSIANTSYRPAYYHILYNGTSAGISGGYGHALGVRLYSSWNYTTAANARTLYIDILETENCTVEMFDAVTKYANMDGTGSTNYVNYTEFDFLYQGLRETGDDNDVNYYNRYYYASRKAVNTVYRYQYVLTKPNGDIVPISVTNNSQEPTKTMNTESFDPFGEIFWYYTTSTTNAGANVPNNVLYDQYLGDWAYSFNVAKGGLTPREPAYIVASPQSDGLAVLASPYITQTLPTEDDGLIYIYLGRVYEDATPYRIYTSLHHPVYWYKNGHIQPFVKNSLTVNGHTVNSDVPANAVFTDTTYESKSAASGGTAVSLVTTGEKYTWNNKSTVPTDHSSTATTYGTGNASKYGHVKLSASTSSTSGESGGIAATPSAVKTAKDRADEAYSKAATVESGLNGTLIYDHTYSISNGVATFTAHVYQKGEEVTSSYADSCFSWSYKLANAVTGTPSVVSLGTGKTKTITISTLGYGGYVLGTFTPA